MISYFNYTVCIPVIKAEFSSSLLQSSVSHDPQKSLLINMMIIINVGISSIFFITCDDYFRIKKF